MLRTTITLTSLCLLTACAPLTSLGDLPTDNGSGATGGSPGSSGAGSTASGGSTASNGNTTADCGPVQLADVAQGIGGFALDGEAEGDESGWAVSAGGDVNGDGVPDVVVGAWNANPNGLHNAGRTYVVFGKADTDTVSLADVAQGVGGFALDGEAAYDGSGASVSAAGDVNGDGLADVLVGAPWADLNGDGSGRTYLVFGKADTDTISLADVAQGIGGFALDGEGIEDYGGGSVSGAGDVNGDGVPDIVVGVWQASPNGVEGAGRTYVVFGKADTDTVSLADVAQGVGGFALDGEAESGRSGVAVSGAGDVNGDGLADVVVGAPGVSPNGLTRSGRTYVVFGKADTDTVSLADVAQGVGGFALDGERGGESARVVSGAGDVNGDGLADVVVGMNGAGSDGLRSRRTYVVFGKADTDAVSLADVAQGVGGFALDGETGAGVFGGSVSGAGDVNRDGVPDVVVGATGVHIDELYSVGRTYVVLGKEDTDTISLADVARGIGGLALDGEAEGDESGVSVSGAGDINGDGLPDVLVGAPGASPSGVQDSGRTYVVFGGDFSCAGG